MASKQISLSDRLQSWPELESRFGTREIDIKSGRYVWEVKPGYSASSRFDESLRKYINSDKYVPGKKAEEYSFSWFEINKNVPGFWFSSVTAEMMEVNGVKYSMSVRYMGPGKVGYFFHVNCDNRIEIKEAKYIVPVLKEIYETAQDINEKSLELSGAIGVFALTMLSPYIGDEVVAGGGVAGAWNALKGLGASASTISLLKTFGLQLGYVFK